jgi:hypothetical protein
MWPLGGHMVKRGFFYGRAAWWIANHQNHTQIKDEAEKMCCNRGHLWGA